MEQRPDIKFFRSYYDAAKMLPDKETQADYLMALLRYAFDDELPSSNGVATAMFLLVKPNLDKSLRLSDAGRKGGQASGKGDASLPEALPKGDASQSQPEIGSMDIGDMDIGSKENISPPINIPPKGDAPQKTKKFVPPSVEDVQEYCLQNCISIDAEQFVDFYASKGWKVGSQSMEDWKAAVRNWARRDREPKKQQKPSGNSAKDKMYAGYQTFKEWYEDDQS